MDREKFRATFGRIMRGMADLIILNLLTFFCSIPIITIGPALCSLFSVTLKIARDEATESARDFFTALKKNFFQGMILGAIALFAAIVIFADGVYAFSLTGTLKIVFCIVTGIVGAVWLTYVCYVFALQAWYENPVTAHIKNAFLLAFVSPMKTILMWVILAIPVLLMLFLPWNAAAYLGSLYLLFGISLPALGISAVLRNVFDKIDPPAQEEEYEEQGTDREAQDQ